MKRLLLPILSVSLLLAACGGGSTPQTADTTAPTVALDASQSGSSVNLLATATDSVGVTRVEFYRGSTLISTDTSAPYAATATVSTADNGSVTYTAKAYDAAGNVGQGSKVVAVNVTVTPPPSTQTLYQGVWGWGIVDPGTGALIDNGAVIFNEEDVSEGRKIGLGVYLNVAPGSDQPGNRMGFAVLGPVSGAGKLETVFSLDTASDRVYFGGEDDNDTLELYQGSLTFEGTGYRFNSSDQPEQQVGILLIQVSDALPNGAAEQNALEAKGKALAAQALKATFNTKAQTTAKVNPALFKAMQQRLQLKR